MMKKLFINFSSVLLLLIFALIINANADELFNKGKDKNEILNNFRQRISNDIKDEFLGAKTQVKKIATFRLSEIMNNNYI